MSGIDIEAEEMAMWREYKDSGSKDCRDRLIIHYYEKMLKKIAGKEWNSFGGTVEYDDLVGYFGLGLIDAIERFDYTRGTKFETYAARRVCGAIKDELRRMDFLPRSERERIKEKMRLGQEITDVKMISIDANNESAAKGEQKPINLVAKDVTEDILMKYIIIDAMKRLSKREKKIIILHTLKSVPYRKIANILGLCESRISQIHIKALKKMKWILQG